MDMPCFFVLQLLPRNLALPLTTQVTHGATTLRKIENLGSRSGSVDGEVRIVKCGVLPNLADSAAANAPDSELLDETGRRADRIMK